MLACVTDISRKAHDAEINAYRNVLTLKLLEVALYRPISRLLSLSFERVL